MSRRIDRPPGLTDAEWSSLQWDCALLDAEAGDSAELANLIRNLAPQRFRKQVVKMIGSIPRRENGPTVRAFDALAILREADVIRGAGGRPNFKALKSEWSEQLRVSRAAIGDVLATRKSYARLAKYRPLYARSTATFTIGGAASGSVVRRRKRRFAPLENG